MGRRVFYISFLAMLMMTIGYISPSSGIDNNCKLAEKVEQEALKRFKSDKKEGLRLLLKAHEYCTDDNGLNFNLGFAYYRYGNFTEAETYLRAAVKKGGNNGEWLNLLAWVMLENRSDRIGALKYAEKAAELKPDSPAASDTFIRAQMENGRLYEAVQSARKARLKWTKDAKIADRYHDVIDEYIAFYLEMTQEKKHNEAIVGLKKIGFDPDVANAYVWALFSAGETEDALEKANTFKRKFSGNESIQDAFDRIMDRFIQNNYRLFREGRRTNAVMAIDKMKNKYADHKGLKQTYDKMFNAVLAEADDIAVPKPIKISLIAKKSRGKGDDLLKQLQGDSSLESSDEDLLVDVDRNIPKSRTDKPRAIGVIIGNKNYSSAGYGVPDVDYAVRDAANMKKYVVNTLGYKEDNLIYTLNATKGQLEMTFGTKENPGKLYNWAKAEGGSSEIFIYYTGHGAPDPGGKGAFLLPVDASVDYILTNGYALDTLYDNLEKIPAKRITVVIDACFSGNSAGGMLLKNVSPAILKSVSPVRELKNTVIFASAGKDQVSNWYPEKRHSLFTYFFMKGIGGDADTNSNKAITVAELKRYLKDKVSYRATRKGREQMPIIRGDDSWVITNLR